MESPQGKGQKWRAPGLDGDGDSVGWWEKRGSYRGLLGEKKPTGALKLPWHICKVEEG